MDPPRAPAATAKRGSGAALRRVSIPIMSQLRAFGEGIAERQKGTARRQRVGQSDSHDVEPWVPRGFDHRALRSSDRSEGRGRSGRRRSKPRDRSSPGSAGTTRETFQPGPYSSSTHGLVYRLPLEHRHTGNRPAGTAGEAPRPQGQRAKASPASHLSVADQPSDNRPEW